MHTYVVTFTNANSVPESEEPTNLWVTVRTIIEPNDVADDADVASVLLRHARAAWAENGEMPPVDWTLADPGWEPALIHMPKGEVLVLI